MKSNGGCMQAVEVYQDPGAPGEGSQFIMLQSTAGTSAASLVYRVEGWAGGLFGNGKLISGSFR